MPTDPYYESQVTDDKDAEYGQDKEIQGGQEKRASCQAQKADVRL